MVTVRPSRNDDPEMLETLRHRLVVSCQPVPGGPMDTLEIVVAFAQAALAGGAAGLRIAGAEPVAAVRAVTDAPLIGLIKRPVDGYERITPHLEDVAALVEAGADIIALDATRRPRPTPLEDLVGAVHQSDRLVMADCADRCDGIAALTVGADMLGSTLSGYLDAVASGRLEDAASSGPDLALVEALSELSPHVLAEGRYNTPEHAAQAIERGAWSVVVGSAITRPEHVTTWFVRSVNTAASACDEHRARCP